LGKTLLLPIYLILGLIRISTGLKLLLFFLSLLIPQIFSFYTIWSIDLINFYIFVSHTTPTCFGINF